VAFLKDEANKNHKRSKIESILQKTHLGESGSCKAAEIDISSFRDKQYNLRPSLEYRIL